MPKDDGEEASQPRGLVPRVAAERFVRSLPGKHHLQTSRGRRSKIREQQDSWFGQRFLHLQHRPRESTEVRCGLFFDQFLIGVEESACLLAERDLTRRVGSRRESYPEGGHMGSQTTH